MTFSAVRAVVVLCTLHSAAAAMHCDPRMTCVCSDNPCDSFQCQDTMSCEGAVLDCDSTSCHMDCIGTKSCQTSHLECQSDTCQVRCVGEHACQQMSTFNQMHVRTSASLDPIGTQFGIWMSARAGTGKLICDGVQSCQASSIGCGSGSCETICNGVQSCQQSSLTVTHTAEAASLRCTNTQSCQLATVDFTSTDGPGTIGCDNTQSCKTATVKCTADHDCTIQCDGKQSCLGMTIICPIWLPNNNTCHINCVGQDSCKDIGRFQVIGQLTATCSDQAGCGPYLSGISTASPATVPPGTIDVLKRLFRIFMNIMKSIFNKTKFVAALMKLLKKLINSVTIYWTCPVSACTPQCPTGVLQKIRSGCTPFDAIYTDSRMASTLAEDSSMVLEFSVDYSDGTESSVEALLAQEAASPSADFEEFKMQNVTVVESEVEEQPGSGDGGLAGGYVALICILVFAAVILAAVLAQRYFKRRMHSKYRHGADATEEEYKPVI